MLNKIISIILPNYIPFKYFSKFTTILFLFFVNCDNRNKNNFNLEIERFENLFEYDLDSINNLISDYPLFLPIFHSRLD